jgi:glucosamine--fructose-6-phosphate aminotransferase (isomerizing)
MQAPSLAVYADILNQAHALEQAYNYQQGQGRRSIELAAQALMSAHDIVLVAVGASYSAGIPFYYRLSGAGRRVQFLDASEFPYFSKLEVGAETVFVLISRSGETVEITKTLRKLKNQGQKIIGVTNEVNSTLASLADYPVLIGGPSDYLISIQTYLTTLFTLDHLVEVALGRTDGNEYQNRFSSLLGQVEKTLDHYQAISSSWRDGFQSYQMIYLLGRGLSLASAHQGSLLFHEMARFPALASSGGSFRHGPWEAIDRRMLSIVYAPDDPALQLNLSLAEDLCALGGRVILISGALSKEVHDKFRKMDRIEIWEIPSCHPDLTPFLEIIPVEFFIFEFARWQGLIPGVFRACTPVTLEETGSQATR